MSSAAKLRKYGRGTATVAAAALVMTSFGPAAFASWDAPAPGQPGTAADFAEQDYGTIGIVDTTAGLVPGDVTPELTSADSPASVRASESTERTAAGVAETANENQGATLVWPGQTGQDIADVRLVIPNRFRSGDIIDLRLLDRSATEESNGNTNADAARTVGFSGTPSLSVDQAPKVGNVDGQGWTTAGTQGSTRVPNGTQVSADTDRTGASVSNTETGTIDWSRDAGFDPTDPADAPYTVKPGVAPSFVVDTSADAAVQGKNNLRIRVTNAANGDPNGAWVVTLSDLKVDLGTAVTPGELRLVPFASSTTDGGSTYTDSDWFGGNRKERRDANGAIVSNGNREIGIFTVPAYVAPVILGTGDLNIQADNYAQTVGDLTVSETAPYSIADGTFRLDISNAEMPVSMADLKVTVNNGGTNETATVRRVDENTLEVTVSGSDSAKASTYTISGLMLQTDTPNRVTFTLSGDTINEWITVAGRSTLTRPASTNSAAVSPWWTFVDQEATSQASISETRGSIVPNQTVAGGTLTDPAMANYLTPGTTYTVSTTSAGDVSYGAGTEAKLTADGSDVAALPDGVYTFADTPATHDGANAVDTYTGTVSGVAAAAPAGTYTFTVSDNGTTGDTSDDTVSVSEGNFVAEDSGNPAAGGSVRDGSGNTLFTVAGAIANGNAVVIANTTELNVLKDGDQVATTTSAGTQFVVGGTTITASQALTTSDTFTVPAAAGATNTVSFPNPNGSGTITLPLNADRTGFTINGRLVTFDAPLANGAAITVTAAVAGVDLQDDVNQLDITPDNALASLVRSAIASAPSARIGGNNRYETAAKIAEMWAAGDKSVVNGKFKNAIIASGENFPDALSASYLSQRMQAPVLLVQRNSIPQDTIEALRDRQVEKVFIVGGPAAVSSEVAAQLRALDTYYVDDRSSNSTLRTTGAKLQAQRLSSANPQNDNRYTTNQLVNMYAAAWGGQNTIGKTVYQYGEASKYTAVFARGDNFPDALAAGVLTAGVKPATGPLSSNDQALPLILTQPDELSAPAVAQIENLDVQHALIIGSENAISNGVKKSIEDRGLTNTRIGGSDRYFTAAAVDEFAMRDKVGSSTNRYPGLGFLTYTNGQPDPANQIPTYLATGLKFPDALTASPWIGMQGAALNLVWPTDLTDGTRDFLTKRAGDISRAIALGLGNAVSTQVLNEANTLVSEK